MSVKDKGLSTAEIEELKKYGLIYPWSPQKMLQILREQSKTIADLRLKVFEHKRAAQDWRELYEATTNSGT